jgi:hypothetical protein
MRMNTNQQRVADSLHEQVMDQLRGEANAVQIRVAFTVLVEVLADGALHDPVETKASLIELRALMNRVQG